MKKRSILFTALALVLVTALSIGGTMAYFSAKATPVTNTITFGNVSIRIDEPGWVESGSEKAKNLMPSETVSKKPIVTNLGNSCFVRVKIPDFSYKSGYGYKKLYNNTFDATDLSNIGDSGKDWRYNPRDGYFYYTKVLAENQSTSYLFDGLTLNKFIKSGTSADVVINAEAIQSAGFVATSRDTDYYDEAVEAFSHVDDDQES